MCFRSAIANPRVPIVAKSSDYGPDSTTGHLLAFGLSLVRYLSACLLVLYDLTSGLLPYFFIFHFISKRRAHNRVQLPAIVQTNCFYLFRHGELLAPESTPPCHSFKFYMMQNTDPSGKRQLLSAGLLKPQLYSKTVILHGEPSPVSYVPSTIAKTIPTWGKLQ